MQAVNDLDRAWGDQILDLPRAPVRVVAPSRTIRGGLSTGA
jgi:hypothetical protein